MDNSIVIIVSDFVRFVNIRMNRILQQINVQVDIPGSKI